MATDADYGSDTACSNAWPKIRNQISGKVNVCYAIARRLITPRGALEAIGEDPNYGLDMRALVNAALTPALRVYWQTLAAQEILKDPRVSDANVVFTQDLSTSTLTVNITIATADDEIPFELVLTIDQLTVVDLQIQEAA